MESNATPSVPRRSDADGDDDMVVDYGAGAEPAPRDDRAAGAPAHRADRVSDPAVGSTASVPTTRSADTAGSPEPTRVTLDPALDAHQRQGVTGGTWIALILGTVILVLLLIFILQNNVAASFAYFGWEFSLPLGIAMLFAAIAGVLITALLGSVRLFKLSRRVRRLEKERAEIKRALR
jgi:uncharacterized integral membrane protein